MTVLIDSWAWVEYFRGSAAGKRARQHIEGDERAVVSTVNIAEVYRYFLKHASPPRAELARRALVRRCEVLDVTIALAVAAAQLRHQKAWGLGDAIIWATAQAAAARVLTGDPDFRKEPGVEFLGS